LPDKKILVRDSSVSHQSISNPGQYSAAINTLYIGGVDDGGGPNGNNGFAFVPSLRDIFPASPDILFIASNEIDYSLERDNESLPPISNFYAVMIYENNLLMRDVLNFQTFVSPVFPWTGTFKYATVFNSEYYLIFYAGTNERFYKLVPDVTYGYALSLFETLTVANNQKYSIQTEFPGFENKKLIAYPENFDLVTVLPRRLRLGATTVPDMLGFSIEAKSTGQPVLIAAYGDVPVGGFTAGQHVGWNKETDTLVVVSDPNNYPLNVIYLGRMKTDSLLGLTGSPFVSSI
jgi:hypothetical protein